MRFIVFVTVAMSALAGCSGGNSPTAPSQNLPSVAGSYRGSITIEPLDGGPSLTCSGVTWVTQSGNGISMWPIDVGGDCPAITIPFGPATIDETGRIAGSGTSGTFTQPSCGTYAYTSSGGFSGRQMQIEIFATSNICSNMNIIISLLR